MAVSTHDAGTRRRLAERAEAQARGPSGNDQLVRVLGVLRHAATAMGDLNRAEAVAGLIPPGQITPSSARDASPTALDEWREKTSHLLTSGAVEQAESMALTHPDLMSGTAP